MNELLGCREPIYSALALLFILAVLFTLVYFGVQALTG